MSVAVKVIDRPGVPGRLVLRVVRAPGLGARLDEHYRERGMIHGSNVESGDPEDPRRSSSRGRRGSP